MRAWQPQSHAGARGGVMVDYAHAVLAPYSAALTKVQQAAGRHEAIALFVCPLAQEACRVWFRRAVPAGAACDDEALRRFQHAVFMQDRPILESQQPNIRFGALRDSGV